MAVSKFLFLNCLKPEVSEIKAAVVTVVSITGPGMGVAFSLSVMAPINWYIQFSFHTSSMVDVR